MVPKPPAEIHSNTHVIYLCTVRRLDRTAKTSRSFLCPAAVLFHRLCWSRRKLAREREARVLLVEFIFQRRGCAVIFFSSGGEGEFHGRAMVATAGGKRRGVLRSRLLPGLSRKKKKPPRVFEYTTTLFLHQLHTEVPSFAICGSGWFPFSLFAAHSNPTRTGDVL